MKWIDIEDQYPNEDSILTFSLGALRVMRIKETKWGNFWVIDSGFACCDGSSCPGFTHWMPLPKPPIGAACLASLKEQDSCQGNLSPSCDPQSS